MTAKILGLFFTGCLCASGAWAGTGGGEITEITPPVVMEAEPQIATTTYVAPAPTMVTTHEVSTTPFWIATIGNAQVIGCNNYFVSTRHVAAYGGQINVTTVNRWIN